MCFDVDSTVIQEEGVDMLAEFKKCGDEVKGNWSISSNARRVVI